MSALVDRVVEDSAPAAAPPPPPLAFDQYRVTSAAALAFSCAARSSTVGAAACCASTLSSSARRFLRISSRVVEPERPSASTSAAQWRTASAMDSSVLVYCWWRTPSRRSSSVLLVASAPSLLKEPQPRYSVKVVLARSDVATQVFDARAHAPQRPRLLRLHPAAAARSARSTRLARN